MSQVFISYRHGQPDEALVEGLERYLSTQGIPVFVDKRIKPGRDWALEIDRQLRASRHLVVFLSENSISSNMVRQEVKTAYELRREGKMTILPVRVAFEGELPYDLASYLNRIQCVAWRPGDSEENLFAQLIAAIREGDPLPSPMGEEDATWITLQSCGNGAEAVGALLPATDTRVGIEPGEPRIHSPLYVRRQKDKLIERYVAISGVLLAIAIAAVVLMVGPGITRKTEPREQQGIGGVDRRIVYDFTRGIDLSSYVIVRGEDSDSLKVCEASADARRTVQKRSYEDAFQKIDAMGRSYSMARPLYIEGFNRLTDSKEQSVLGEEIRFLRASEVYDSTRNQYRYVVDLGVSKSLRLAQELEDALRRALRGYEPRQVNGQSYIDVNEVLGHLKNDRSFQTEVRRRLAEDSSSLWYQDDDTLRLMRLIGGAPLVESSIYDPGKYKISALILQPVAQEVAAALKHHERVIVVAEGAAEAFSLRSTIPYSGAGRVGKVGELLKFGGQGGLPVSYGIRNNLDLSFVRGYEGIRTLAEMLGPKIHGGRIELFYTGKGRVADDSSRRPGSRRLIFRIIFRSRL